MEKSIRDIFLVREDLNLNTIVSNFGVDPRDVGIVVAINDGIVYIIGLENVTYGEVVTIHVDSLVKEKALVLNLDIGLVSAVVLTNEANVRPGLFVTRDYTPMSIPAGEYQMGRVLNPLGNFIDDIQVKKERDQE